jgi:hypothetical protein
MRIEVRNCAPGICFERPPYLGHRLGERAYGERLRSFSGFSVTVRGCRWLACRSRSRSTVATVAVGVRATSGNVAAGRSSAWLQLGGGVPPATTQRRRLDADRPARRCPPGRHELDPDVLRKQQRTLPRNDSQRDEQQGRAELQAPADQVATSLPSRQLIEAVGELSCTSRCRCGRSGRCRGPRSRVVPDRSTASGSRVKDDEQRDQHGRRHRDAELEEEAADDAAHEGDGQEHGDDARSVVARTARPISLVPSMAAWRCDLADVRGGG